MIERLRLQYLIPLSLAFILTLGFLWAVRYTWITSSDQALQYISDYKAHISFCDPLLKTKTASDIPAYCSVWYK